jgi:hypothetical protein
MTLAVHRKINVVDIYMVKNTVEIYSSPLHAFMAWTGTALHVGNMMLLVLVLY